jgi:hypothetical protein
MTCRRKFQILAIFHFKILSITSNHIFQVENLLIFFPKESLGGTMGKKEDGKVIFAKLVSPKCTQIPQFTKSF